MARSQPSLAYAPPAALRACRSHRTLTRRSCGGGSWWLSSPPEPRRCCLPAHSRAGALSAAGWIGRGDIWPRSSMSPAASITMCHSPVAAMASPFNRGLAVWWCLRGAPAIGPSFWTRRPAERWDGSPPSPDGTSMAMARSVRTGPFSICRRTGSRTAPGSSGCGTSRSTGGGSAIGRAMGWVRTR